MTNILVTGGLGFIASNFVNHIVKSKPNIEKIIILDKMDYCSSSQNVEPNQKVEIVIGNISNAELVNHLLISFKIDTVVHFAASTHVDNSFLNSVTFSKNNVVGTHVLLECCKNYMETYGLFKKFVHISTDEVYGEVQDGDMKHEGSLLDPTNPYAATKAGAEFLVKSYLHSYKLPIVITRGNNVYGPNQYPEKLIPRFIGLLLKAKLLTVHGTGKTKRNFIHVYDVVRAVETVMDNGIIGEIYNISSCLQNEFTVLEIAKKLITLFHGANNDISRYLNYVEDRKFNDYRYCIDDQKLRDLGWSATKIDIDANLVDLIEWYKINMEKHFPLWTQ